MCPNESGILNRQTGSAPRRPSARGWRGGIAPDDRLAQSDGDGRSHRPGRILMCVGRCDSGTPPRELEGLVKRHLAAMRAASIGESAIEPAAGGPAPSRAGHPRVPGFARGSLRGSRAGVSREAGSRGGRPGAASSPRIEFTFDITASATSVTWPRSWNSSMSWRSDSPSREAASACWRRCTEF